MAVTRTPLLLELYFFFAPRPSLAPRGPPLRQLKSIRQLKKTIEWDNPTKESYVWFVSEKKETNVVDLPGRDPSEPPTLITGPKEKKEEEEGERGKLREREIKTPGFPACPHPFNAASDSNRRECAHCYWGVGFGSLCGPLFV